jgi:DNA-binding MarR family transcriptional regulator
VHEERRREIYTMQYDPGEPAKEDLRGLLNPVLKYIDPVKPLEFMALYTLYREKSLGIGDLAARLGARREELEKALNTLAGRGS